MEQEFRKHPRATPGAHLRLSFEYGGHPFVHLPMLALSESGCSLIAPESLLRLMDVIEPSVPLEQVLVEGDCLPHHPMRARIVHTTGHNPTMLGLEFLDASPDFRRELSRCVTALLRPH